MTIRLVYQDCPMCGSRKNWGEKQIEKANTAGLQVEKISFASPEGSHLCKEALFAGVTRLPFFTNGLIFRETIDDFIQKDEKAEKPKKTAKRKTTRKKKEA
jgi:hypothetical protein